MMRQPLLATAALLAIGIAALVGRPALADTLSWGFIDSTMGPFGTPVQLIGSANVVPNQMLLFTAPPLPDGFHVAQIDSILRPQPDGSFRFDSGYNDLVSGRGGSITLFSSWQGVVTGNNQFTMPSFFEVSEHQFGGSFVVYNQVYVCTGVTFCLNGQVGNNVILTDISQINLTLNGLAPGQPFTITEVFTYSQTSPDFLIPPNIGGGMGVNPIGVVNPVPGPIIGTGLSGLLALIGGLWLHRRKKLAG